MLVSKLILINLLLSSLLLAEETNKPSCEETYNTCLETCEVNQDNISDCYSLCDEKYEKCLKVTEKMQEDS